jgi:hypothetical protein
MPLSTLRSGLALAALAVLAACSSPGGAAAPAAADAGAPPTGPLVTVSGRAFVFGMSGGSLAGATVSAAEAPEHAGTVGADGSFSLEVPSDADYSFLLRFEGYQDTQTATLHVGAAGLDQVGFQVPSTSMVALLGAILSFTPDATRCQIATTVSAVGTAPYGGSGLGEPDVTVAIDPPLPAAAGPVYFKYVSESVIVPDRALHATTKDGGVLFLDVPPGDYRLTATKPGKTIDPVSLHCRAGVLVNAAPPRGLQTR